MTINDGEMGEIKIAVKKEIGEAPKTQTSKPKSKKGPEAAAERRRRKGWYTTDITIFTNYS